MAVNPQYVNMAQVMMEGEVKEAASLVMGVGNLPVQLAQFETKKGGELAKLPDSQTSAFKFDAKSFYNTPGLEWDIQEPVEVSDHHEIGDLAGCQTGPECFVCQTKLTFEEIHGICTKCISTS